MLTSFENTGFHCVSSGLLAAADAQLGQAATKYEKSFLLALDDVENAFVAHTSSMEHREQLSQAETAANKTFQSTEACGESLFLRKLLWASLPNKRQKSRDR